MAGNCKSNDLKIVLSQWIVKDKIASSNCPRFSGKITGFHLKSCILKENAKNSTSGRSLRIPESFVARCRIYLFHLLLLMGKVPWMLKITKRSHAFRFSIFSEYQNPSHSVNTQLRKFTSLCARHTNKKASPNAGACLWKDSKTLNLINSNPSCCAPRASTRPCRSRLPSWPCSHRESSWGSR